MSLFALFAVALGYEPKATVNEHFLEVCRQRALHPDLQVMSGRQHAAATRFISLNIVAATNPQPDATIVDVGCGNGAALLAVAELNRSNRLIGILPTEEEVQRATRETPFEIKRGLVTDTGLDTGISDVTICNSVLTAIPRHAYDNALAELRRITKPGGTVFIGEVRIDPENPLSLRQKIRHWLTSKSPWTTGSWMRHRKFIALARRNGLQLIKDVRHVNMDDELRPMQMRGRRDFVFKAVD